MKINIDNRKMCLSLGKSTVMLVMLFIMNMLLDKTYAQGVVYAAPESKETCTEKTITGKTDLEQLEQVPEFWMVYLRHYADYGIDREKLMTIARELNRKSIKIMAVIGTWCGDTKEQLPVLQKILDNLPKDNKFVIEYIGVNRDKIADGLDIKHLDINFIPVFIFYENDQEIGRIVETPSSTMENDIVRILRGDK